MVVVGSGGAGKATLAGGPGAARASVVRRSLRHRGRTRPDVGPGCPDRLPDREFARWIRSYPSSRRAGVLELLADLERRGGRAVVLRTAGEVRRYLDALPTPGGRPAAVSIAGK
jgi:hypothetical protein